MTAATRRAVIGSASAFPEPQPRRLSWTMVTAVAGILTAAGGAMWSLASDEASTRQRVTSLEQQVPPGAIQRLDERTQLMKDALDRLERAAGTR